MLTQRIREALTEARALPRSREVSLCITKLEEAAMWADAAPPGDPDTIQGGTLRAPAPAPATRVDATREQAAALGGHAFEPSTEERRQDAMRHPHDRHLVHGNAPIPDVGEAS